MRKNMMVETLRSKKENKIKKLGKIAETHKQ